MQSNVILDTCDICGASKSISSSENVPRWTVPSEVGDLCPSCARSWLEHKQSFIIRMKKENGKDLV